MDDASRTVEELAAQSGRAAATLPRVVHDASALVLLVDLTTAEVVYANHLAEQAAPDLGLPVSLHAWSRAAGLRDLGRSRTGGPQTGIVLSDGGGPVAALDRVLRGEPVNGQLVSAARATDSATAREPLWLVGLPLVGAPGPLGAQALLTLLPVDTHDTQSHDDAFYTRAVLATDLSFTISDVRLPDDPLVWVNPAFERITGYRAEDALGRNCRFLQGEATDRPTARRLGAAIRSRARTTERLLNYRADGTAFWNEISISPVFDADRECTHYVGVQADVTQKVDADRQRDDATDRAARALTAERAARADAERAQQRLALMAEATTLLSGTLDVAESLDRLIGLIVPLLADWVAINLLDAAGRLVPAATRHRDGREGLLARYAELQSSTLTDDSPLRQALATGEMQVRSPLTLAEAAAHTRSGELMDVVTALGVHAALYVPLVARQRVLGVMTLVSGSSQRLFDAGDQRLVADLARRAAMAMDNARLYAAEHETALTLQRSLLPQMPDIEGLDLAALYLPGGDLAEIGGDWYDVLSLPDGTVGIAIGDVMGHDLAAASAMGQLRSVLRSYAWEGDGPGLVLDRLDRLVQGLDMAQLATCVYARLTFDGQGAAALCYANAGHHAPMLRLPDGTVTRLEDGQGVVIGVAPGDDRPEGEVDLPAGSVLLLFTDGLVESRTRDLDVGVDEVERLLAAHDPAAGAEALVTELSALADLHGGDDDVCILVLRVR
jgi:PAS domain S-box-containing protein